MASRDRQREHSTASNLAASASRGSALLVEAKLQRPVPRSETINRLRLTGLLDERDDRRVITLRAPAGYGKTTAVAGWLASRLADVAWLTCDGEDRDAARFLAHLLAAIARAVPKATGEAERALYAGAGLCEEVVPLLGNGLFRHATHRLVVVLDDVHLIEGSTSLRLISRLIKLAPTVTIVLVGRRIPELPLARWVAAGEATQLGVGDLRFDAEETERFLNGSLHLDFSAEQLALIADRVEGWAAGLSLLATALGGGVSRPRLVETLSGTWETMSAYLMEEMLGALDNRVLEFMTRTSILRRLNVEVCEAVIGEDGVRELIDEVRRSNLLIADVDDHHQWFRYHHLLSDVLHERLQRNEPGLIADLHRRACAWFEAAGFPAEAIEHALESGDGERGAALLSDSWLTMCHARRGTTVSRVLERLPAQVGPYQPAVQAIALYVRSLVEGTADVWDETAELARVERAIDPPGLSRVIDAGVLTPFHGDVAGAVRRGPAALRRAADASPVDRYAITVQYGAMLWLAGDRPRARSVLSGAVAVPGSFVSDIWRLWALSGAALDDGDIDAALRLGDAAVSAVRASGTRSVNARAPALQARGWALLAAGHIDDGARHLEAAETVVSETRDPLHHLPNLAIRAQLHLARREWRAGRGIAAKALRFADRFADVGIYRTRLENIQLALNAPTHAPASASAAAPTAAELRVLRLLDRGLSVAQIARTLHVSVNTVRSHRRRLYRRLGATSRDDATQIAHARGLI